MKSNKSGLQVTHVDDFANLICSLSGAAEMQSKTRLSSILPLLLNSVYFFYCFKTQIMLIFKNYFIFVQSDEQQTDHLFNE